MASSQGPDLPTQERGTPLILVIEARLDWNTTLASTLNPAGYETVHAHNRAEAHAALGEHSEDINAAVVDLILPDPNKHSPWDAGVAVCGMLVERHIPYILCTVVAQEDIPQDIRDRSAGYIKKPLYERSELLAVVAEATQDRS